MLTSSPAVSPSATAPAAGPVTFGLQPGQPADGQPGGDRPFFQYGVAPGTIVQDSVAITNYSARALTMQLYSTDSVNTANGDFALLSEDQRPTDAGLWTSLASSQAVTVPARSEGGNGNQVAGRVVVPFSVIVPENASPGDHVGGVVASLNTANANGGGPNVRLDQRVAVRMFLRVAGPLRPALQLLGLRVDLQGGSNPLVTSVATVTFTLHNTGNLALTGRERVSVRGLLGRTGSRINADLPLLLPGASTNNSVQIRGVRNLGRLRASALLSELSSPGHLVTGLAPISAEATAEQPSGLIIAAIAITVILAIFLMLLVRRRKRPATRAKHGRRVPATQGRRRASHASRRPPNGRSRRRRRQRGVST